MTPPGWLSSLGAVLLLCVAFLRGQALRRLGEGAHRTFVSVAGGAAVAYVFVDLSPELHSAAGAFHLATAHLESRVLEFGVHLATMTGFLFFYGVEALVLRSRDGAEPTARRDAGNGHPLFRIHLLAFAAYAWLVGYLLVRAPGHVGAALAFYAVAMSLHFLCVANALREEHGDRYDRAGAPVLAASCLAGWACGRTFGLPETTLGVLLGLVAGGVIANTVLSELPREKEGKFVPFVLGAILYAALLVIAG